MRHLSRLSLLLCLTAQVFAATFTVTTNSDAGAGSLRDAITTANANPGLDTIAFSIGGGGPQVINIASALPSLTDAVIIDGTTQPGFAGTPIITLDGPGVFVSGDGLRIVSSPVTIRGLVIVDFAEAAIGIESGGDGATIVGNYLGVDASGAVAKGNTDGIRTLNDVDDLMIGGAAAADRNVISGNRSSGIFFWAVNGIGATDDSVIRGNIVGLDATGTFALSNETGGIVIDGGDNNRIGGTAPGEANIISGNGQDGLEIRTGFHPTTLDHAVGNVVQGNLIGTNIDGTLPVPNGTTGVAIFGARTTTVGGASVAARNVISSNGWNGVVSGTICFGGGGCAVAEDTLIEGNLIGTDVTGTQDRGNTLQGVLVTGAARTTIRGNVISGNGLNGIQTLGAGTTTGTVVPVDTLVVSNRIGTNAAGTAALPNGAAGVAILSGQDTIVGGTAAGEGNTIWFNTENGITMFSGSGNQFLGNSIDLNGGLGIDLGQDGVTPNDLLDPDTGGNDRQNFPVLTSATVDASTEVRGTFNSIPNRTFRIEFFNSPAADPSGFGEGRTFLGFVNVTTDAGGNAAIAATLPAVPTASVVTATATDLTLLNTSEFSNAVEALAPPELNVSDVVVAEGDAGTTPAMFTVELTSPAAEDVTFQYATANGTATAPGDYTPVSGTGTIPAGSLSTTVTVQVLGDTAFEPDETFVLNVTAIDGATGADVQGQATITNDDAAVPAAPIPTASEWALLVLAVLLGLAGVYVVRS